MPTWIDEPQPTLVLTSKSTGRTINPDNPGANPLTSSDTAAPMTPDTGSVIAGPVGSYNHGFTDGTY